MSNLNSQNIVSTWKGELNLPGNTLLLPFHVECACQGLKSTMDSPGQGAYRIEHALQK